MSKAHVAILGAGPAGLEAALACHEHGFSFTLYEAASRVAGHVQDWRHVRMFTPWDMNISTRMATALRRAGKAVPEGDHCPTGGELVDEVLKPVAETSEIAPHLRLSSKVLSVGREGLLKHEEIGSAARAGRAFRLLIEDASGEERFERADVIFDCTGNTVPNSLGGSGVPALGERRFDDRIVRRVPPSEELRTIAEGRVLLVGAGHSAQTALAGLLDAKAAVHWVLRGGNPEPLADDPLPERSALMTRAAQAASDPPAGLVVHTRTTVESIGETAEGSLAVELAGRDGVTTVEVDRVLALTGRVGDHLIYRQLQIHECYATSGPMKLAAALLGASGAGGDCLAQTSLGPETLKSPEPGFFILGSKSYGRRNDYLMSVGRQQVDEIFQLLD